MVEDLKVIEGEILTLLKDEDELEYAISLLSLDIPEVVNKAFYDTLIKTLSIKTVPVDKVLSRERYNYILDHSIYYKDANKFLLK